MSKLENCLSDFVETRRIFMPTTQNQGVMVSVVDLSAPMSVEIYRRKNGGD